MSKHPHHGLNIFVKVVLTAALPFVIIGLFAVRLYEGVRSAIRYARSETREAMGEYRREMAMTDAERTIEYNKYIRSRKP